MLFFLKFLILYYFLLTFTNHVSELSTFLNFLNLSLLKEAQIHDEVCVEKGGSFFLHLCFFCSSKISSNSQNTLWPFKETHKHHTPKNTFGCRLPEVKIYHRKSTSRSQNISPEVDFRKSKYITGSRPPEVKNNYRKLTSENKKTLPKVDFRKSKNITESRLPELKKRKSILHIFNSF